MMVENYLIIRQQHAKSISYCYRRATNFWLERNFYFCQKYSYYLFGTQATKHKFSKSLPHYPHFATLTHFSHSLFICFSAAKHSLRANSIVSETMTTIKIFLLMNFSKSRNFSVESRSHYWQRNEKFSEKICSFMVQLNSRALTFDNYMKFFFISPLLKKKFIEQ